MKQKMSLSEWSTLLVLCVPILVFGVAAIGCQQLTPMQHWYVAGQSYVVAGNTVADLYEAGELNHEDLVKASEYAPVIDAALDQWYASILAGDSPAAAIRQFNVVMDELIKIQKEK